LTSPLLRAPDPLTGQRWFSIPAHRPFAEDLARGLLEHFEGQGPEALSDAIILTPTRRSGRVLAEAFLSQAPGRALLLPQIRPLGDLDEGEPPFEPGDLSLDLPPAISPWRRRFELARLTAARLGGDVPVTGVPVTAILDMADALAAFLDSLQIEEVPADIAREKITGLVTGDLAAHWQVSADLLGDVLEAWPQRLDALGLIDVADRRVRLLRALTEQWTARPPQGVLVAAGSTGTAKSTADLLVAIAKAPRGAVVLPGLDEGLAESAWKDVGEQHPQGAMKRLLERAGVTRAAVGEWPGEPDARGRWRRRLINEALRPPEATADWLQQIGALRAEAAGEDIDPIAEGFAGLALVTTAGDEEAALTCAILIREKLEEPGATAALITPDLALARRVSARLARWGIEADASAGRPLSGFPTAILAVLAARLTADPSDPVRLLATLKTSCVRLGMAAEIFERAAAALEAFGLRGPRKEGLEALLARLATGAEPGRGRSAADPERLEAIDLARTLAVRLDAALSLARAPFTSGEALPAEAARGVALAMEALAEGPEGGAGDLWAGPGGEGTGAVLAALAGEGEALPPATPEAFADLLHRLIDGESVRAPGAAHPRVRILGAIEARMTRADRLVLAGLEEGVWPRGAPVDPFLSRPMRKALGLPPPERRVGLTAHDFAQAACAPDVILVHSQRREGSPAVESRWLWRLRTLARGAKVTIPGRDDVLGWARGLDHVADYKPVPRPAPTPPVADRPRRMAVTRLEALTRDPYAVWARDILRLYPMERPDEPVEARARGTAIHKAFERLSELFPGPVPDNAAELFEGFYLEELELAGMPQAALAREAALAVEAARWVADLERERRADGRRLVIEAEGTLTFDEGLVAPFTLTARADRIELAPANGEHGPVGHILDYKTGKAPSKKIVDAGFSPQLTLTAAILMAGGFPGVPPTEPGDLTYLEITGRKPAGKVETRGEAGVDSLEKTQKALWGAKQLIQRFDNQATAYVSRTAPQYVHDYAGDYGHLARVFEWSTSGEEGEGE
jgi:ATP-dependent helicase/nuclease subunit B